MKVIHFTIPVPQDRAIILQKEDQAFFYPHLHQHNEIQITCIQESRGTLIAGDHIGSFQPGDVFVIGASQPHVFKNEAAHFAKKSKLKAKALTVFIHPKYLDLMQPFPEAGFMTRLPQISGNGLSIHPRHKKAVQDIIEQLHAAKAPEHFILFCRLISFIVHHPHTTLASKNKQQALSEKEGLRMNDIYQYSLQHFTEDITIDTIAGIAFLTPQAFCRYFKKHTRKTYIQFLNELRISEACKLLLAATPSSVADAGFACGFNSAVSFNRVFKKITGIAPLQWQKRYQQMA